jgi:excisionase family DNA binding protein
MSTDPDVDFAPKPIRPLLTTGEFLRIVPVSSTVLRRLLDSGQLRAVRIGQRLYFRPEDVEDFLRSCSA